MIKRLHSKFKVLTFIDLISDIFIVSSEMITINLFPCLFPIISIISNIGIAEIGSGKIFVHIPISVERHFANGLFSFLAFQKCFN